jgi:hypothetical protein
MAYESVMGEDWWKLWCLLLSASLIWLLFTALNCTIEAVDNNTSDIVVELNYERSLAAFRQEQREHKQDQELYNQYLKQVEQQ